MTSDCEIADAIIVTPHDRYRGTIAIAAGQVAAILDHPTGNAKHTIDAAGLVALPGMVDQHVHFMDPGPVEREDFARGSSSAAIGGVTTVVEHTHSNPVLTTRDLRDKVAHLAGRSLIDYGLAAHVFPDTIDEVPSLWDAGIAMFKAFTCTTHGVPALLSDDLLRLFQVVAATGARALVHCEDEFITRSNEGRLRAAHRTDYGVLTEWRSAEAELLAVSEVALLSRLTGAVVTIAHASQPAVVDLVRRERPLGARLTVESCPQYLYLTAEEVRKHGPTRKFTPPARDVPAGRVLRDRLRNGEIDVISSDHAPSTLQQKLADDIWGCPFGLPGVQTTLTLLLNGVHEGWITLEQVAQVYSENPARLLGIYPRKGAIRIGSDADLALVDMDSEHVLRNEDIASKAGWTPFAGMRVRGKPVMTLLRGEIVAEDGRVAAEPGAGQFLTRPLGEGIDPVAARGC